MWSRSRARDTRPVTDDVEEKVATTKRNSMYKYIEWTSRVGLREEKVVWPNAVGRVPWPSTYGLRLAPSRLALCRYWYDIQPTERQGPRWRVSDGRQPPIFPPFLHTSTVHGSCSVLLLLAFSSSFRTHLTIPLNSLFSAVAISEE